MSDTVFVIKPESAADLPALERLSERAFGPGRFARTAYRVREDAEPDARLSFVAWRDGHAVGSIRFTPARIGGKSSAILLGPLAVDPDFAGQGAGQKLITQGLEAAREAGYKLVILVGDHSYFARTGFAPVPAGQISFPGPVDRARILAAELEEGTLAGLSGLVRAG